MSLFTNSELNKYSRSLKLRLLFVCITLRDRQRRYALSLAD